MPQTVDIAGFGKVNFPDEFSPQQIQEAIERDITPNIGGTPFEQANAKLEAGGRVGFRADQKKGEEFVAGAYNKGAPPRRPKLYEAPQPAPEGNLGAAIKDNIAADEGTRLRLIADSLFPGDPNGLQRVGIRNGKPVFVNDEGKLQYVSGTKSNLLGGLIGNSPEIAGGIAGSLTGSPVLGGAAGATLGKAVKRGLSNLFFDEPVTPASLGKELAVEAGTNLVGGLAGKGVAKFADRGRVVSFAPSQLQQAEATRALIKQRTGIDLDLAQASGDRRLIALRDFAARYPGRSAELIQAQDEIASGQFDLATKRVLDLVATAQPAEVAGKNAINAAKETIRLARASVSQQVRPLYEAAYASVPQITDVGLLNYLKLPYFDEAFKAGQRIAKLEGTSLGPGDLPDLRSFDYLKQGLDDVIQVLSDKGARKEAAALTARKDAFVAQLDSLSNQQYQAARQAYAQGMAAQVNPLEEGFVGVLAKLDPIDASTASRIFVDPSITPEQIALLKSRISQTNPDAYRGLVRQYLAAQYDNAQVVTQGGDVVNVPGKFLKRLAPTPGKLDNLKAILPPNSLPVLEDLLQAADALAATPLGASRAAGSNTFRDQTLSELLKGRAVAVAKALLTPRQAIKEATELRAQEEGIEKLTEALIDPAKRDQLRRIVSMKDSTKKAILLGGLLGSQAAVGSAEDLTENRPPGEAARQ